MGFNAKLHNVNVQEFRGVIVPDPALPHIHVYVFVMSFLFRVFHGYVHLTRYNVSGMLWGGKSCNLMHCDLLCPWDCVPMLRFYCQWSLCQPPVTHAARTYRAHFWRTLQVVSFRWCPAAWPRLWFHWEGNNFAYTSWALDFDSIRLPV